MTADSLGQPLQLGPYLLGRILKYLTIGNLNTEQDIRVDVGSIIVELGLIGTRML
ncbi:hypothetical protein [Mycolicibacterium hippocampi]|uniref:hypothetical protein n=1 Tax=Mycolicibacterium hippocampi TaxID=659824 RepID=UPI003517EE87